MTYPVKYLTSRGIPIAVARVYAAIVSSGRFGVDMFFLLSAYLITDLLLREKNKFGRLHVKWFYLRRLLRIWPLYFFFIALVTLVPALELNWGKDISFKYVMAFLLLSGNWACIIWGWPISVLGPLWSVSVEEQFYLLWPPVVAYLKHKSIAWAAVVMIVLANVERVAEIAFYHHAWGTMWPNTIAHLDSLAAGIFIAVILKGNIRQWRTGTRIILAVTALCILGVRATRVVRDVPQGLPDTAFYPLVPIACSMMLFAFLGLRAKPGILTYLGKISYGLYVYHLMALHISDVALSGMRLGPKHAVLRVVAAFALTLGISALSYAMLERPFLRLKERFTWVKSRPA
jgi:peptidoglycan/LPS O-acetylase OafA/YrhL